MAHEHPVRQAWSHGSPMRALRDCLLMLIALLVGLAIGNRHRQPSCVTPAPVLHGGRGLIAPVFDHNESEATYHASQQAAQQYLETHDEVRTGIDVWYLMNAFYSCPSRERIGRPLDGGKWVCAARQLLAHSDCVIYFVGSNGEVSFEKALLAQFPHCQMHTYDPTLTRKRQWKVQLTSGVTFHKHGIVSEAGLAAAGDEYTTLPRSMAANNASWIDILKIDIEGGEWSVFAELLDSGAPLPFTQVLIEIHTNMIAGGGAGRLPMLRKFFGGMARAGYRVFSVEPNYIAATECLEYAFVKVDERGRFITGPG